jgi:hypothetical protein
MSLILHKLIEHMVARKIARRKRKKGEIAELVCGLS